MMTTKSNNYECCMCGDLGLSFQLFRCKLCHFRSQHRYCSNLYPKAESYSICNWCLIQKLDDHQLQGTLKSNNSTNSPCSQNINPTKNSSHHANGLKVASVGSTSLQPTSPIKKLTRSPEGGSRLGRKRINGPTQDQKQLRRTKSFEISDGNNNNLSSSTRSSGGGGPAVIKHVFRNKMRRYKLLDEVSC